jgi:DNA (cytosine-5)-methyltransferase 1
VDAGQQPIGALTGTESKALVMANREHNVPAAADEVPTKAVATGEHLALIMRNNGDKSGEQTTPAGEPIRTLTAKCHQSLVIPYYRTGTASDPEQSAAPTVSTKDRLALVVPYTREGRLRAAVRETLTTVATEGAPAIVITEQDIDNSYFRMFDLHEIAAAMAMDKHVDNEADYMVLGNKREKMAQYGNAVTPPAMELQVRRHLEVIS